VVIFDAICRSIWVGYRQNTPDLLRDKGIVLNEPSVVSAGCMD